MAIDYRILQQQPQRGLFDSAIQGFNQGAQMREDYTRRGLLARAEQERRSQTGREEGFRQNLGGLLGSMGEYAYTPEGQRQLFTSMSQAGYGKEMAGLLGGVPQMQRPAQPEYQFKEFGESAVTFNPSTGEARQVPGLTKPKKQEGPTPYEIAKDKWERDFKERQLRASMGNTAKDNELASAKFDLNKAKTEAEMARKATDVGEVESQADAAVNLIDQMIGSEDGKIKRHPGFSTSVGAQGMSSLFGLMDAPVAGTDAAGFRALYDQVKGGAFMEAVQKMKGLGTLTETEGKAATAAISRMQLATSESEFIKAAQEFRTAIKGRKARVLAKAAAAPHLPGQVAPAADSTGWTQIAPGIRVRQKP